MSWFDAGALSKYSSYAKTALKQAQKNIDKVLDIKDEVGAGTSSHETVNRGTYHLFVIFLVFCLFHG